MIKTAFIASLLLGSVVAVGAAQNRKKTNLLDCDQTMHSKVLEKFQATISALPDNDAHPIYESRAPNSWDMKVGGI